MSRQATSLLAFSVVAASGITGGRFVTVAGAHAAAGAAALGVSRSDAAAGERVTVDHLGTAIVEAGAEITAGQFLKVGTAGKAIPHTDTTIPVAQAAPGEVAAGDGSFLEVILLPSRPLQVIA